MDKLAETDAVAEDTQERLALIGEADLILGIPTSQNRQTIGTVTQAVLEALRNRLSNRRSVIVNADGASKDGTPEHLRELVGDHVPLLQVRYPIYPVRRLSAPLAGVPGRQEAAGTILRVAHQLRAKACVLVDPELESITPEWIHRLTAPVLAQEVDLLVPRYQRRKYDGMINSGIVSPFMRALYGKRLRQPIGADLALSARLVDFYTAQESGNGNGPSSFDPWSTAPAVCHGFRVGQTFLGPRVVHQREVSPDLSETLGLVLTNIFEQMERTAAFWQKVRGSEPAPWFGPPLEFDPGNSDVNVKRMTDSFRMGCQDLMEIWKLILPPATLLELRKMVRRPDEEFRFADALWAQTVYDFALGYHLRVMRRDHLLAAFTPLYLGWAASFVAETQSAGPQEVADRVEQLSMHFEAQKRYLISRWRWPDKFNP